MAKSGPIDIRIKSRMRIMITIRIKLFPLTL
jgi:hypothetical protein